MPTVHDRAVTLFNPLVARMTREETGANPRNLP
jgi:hypothetical protein